MQPEPIEPEPFEVFATESAERLFRMSGGLIRRPAAPASIEDRVREWVERGERELGIKVLSIAYRTVAGPPSRYTLLTFQDDYYSHQA